MTLGRMAISLDDLACFAAIADSGSFSVAAARLGLPKSSLSRRIERLERALGERLLHRTTRRVSLSTAGADLLERTGPTLRALHLAVTDLPEPGGAPAGELRVTAPNDYGNRVLAGLLPEFNRRYPAIRLDLHLTNRTVDLIGEGFDLAVRVVIGTPADSGMVVRKLAQTDLCVYAAPGYLAHRGTPRSLDEASGHDWILFKSARNRREPHPPGRILALVDDFQFVHTATRAGAGLGRMPSFLAASDVREGRLVRVLPRESWSEGRFCLVYPKTRQASRKVAALRDFLIESLDA